ncbi:hypothetical protein [Qipengyuania sp. NPDC077563]|uniref:hypothetical protein n=1 Tax=Qipengyuania sp. NPDC077563 TaxID=3364497 RepID=UPI003851200E
MTIDAPRQVLAKVEEDNPFFDIIGDAYRIFSRAKPDSTEVCQTCCMDGAIEADFFNPDIADLPLDYVQDWYFAAHRLPEIAKSTWAYLLPRVLEILACHCDVASVGPEVALQRFETGNPENWTGEEWDVLDRFQRLYLRLQLERSRPFNISPQPLDEAMCMFAAGGWPVAKLVEQIDHAPDEVLAARFHYDWCECQRPGEASISISALWPDQKNIEVWDYYVSPRLHDRMAALGLSETADPEIAGKAFRVASLIEANWV